MLDKKYLSAAVKIQNIFDMRDYALEQNSVYGMRIAELYLHYGLRTIPSALEIEQHTRTRLVDPERPDLQHQWRVHANAHLFLELKKPRPFADIAYPMLPYTKWGDENFHEAVSLYADKAGYPSEDDLLWQIAYQVVGAGWKLLPLTADAFVLLVQEMPE